MLNLIQINFFKRFITAILGVIILLFLIKIGSVPFFLLIMIISIFLLYEYFSLISKMKIQCYKFLCLSFLVFMQIFFFLQNDSSKFNNLNISSNIFTIILTLFSIFILSFPILFSFFHKNSDIKLIFLSIISNIFGVFYIGWMFSHLILIREFYGKELTYTLFFIIWVMDTFAYIFGSKFGKTKFTKISPNKSIEGALAGLISAIFSSIILHNFIFKINSFSIINSIVIGFLIGIFAQVGDIFESLIKRISGEKDSGMFLPGHGGFLDRFDSIIFSAPIYFYFLVILKTIK